MLKCHIMVLKFRMRTEVSEETVEKFSNLSFLKSEAFVHLTSSLYGETGLSVQYPKRGVLPGSRWPLSPGPRNRQGRGEAGVEAPGSPWGPF